MIVVLKLIMRGRKYFTCTQKSAHKVHQAKLVIDKNSEDLELGEHELSVIDISLRNKYGTDLIYKLDKPGADRL